VLKTQFASSVLHSCNVQTQICVTRPQCVKLGGLKEGVVIGGEKCRTALKLQNVP